MSLSIHYALQCVKERLLIVMLFCGLESIFSFIIRVYTPIEQQRNLWRSDNIHYTICIFPIQISLYCHSIIFFLYKPVTFWFWNQSEIYFRTSRTLNNNGWSFEIRLCGCCRLLLYAGMSESTSEKWIICTIYVYP